MNKLNSKGIFAGAVVWFLVVIFSSTKMDCLNYRTCGASDMFMFGVISLSLLAPAWLVAIVISGVTSKEK